MPDIWLLPYLPLDRRVSIGSFGLVPKADIRDGDAVSPQVAAFVRGVFALYRLPGEGHHKRVGALVVPRDQRAGDPLNREGYGPLHAAVVTAVLDANPREPAKRQGGGGAYTSENALMFGHPITDDGSVVFSFGSMSRTLVGGYQAGKDNGVIEPPGDLAFPVMLETFDPEYADAVLQVVTGPTAVGRRVDRAIEWLDLLWRNSTALSAAARIVIARAGFEALLGVGEDFKAGRKALAKLLEPGNTQRKPQHILEARQEDDGERGSNGP